MNHWFYWYVLLLLLTNLEDIKKMQYYFYENYVGIKLK